MTDFGSPKPPQVTPKSIQNRSQNESKIKTIFDIEKIALQDRLGAVLGRSWAAQTSIFVLWLQRRSFFEKSHFLNKSHLKAQLDRQNGEK